MNDAHYQWQRVKKSKLYELVGMPGLSVELTNWHTGANITMPDGKKIIVKKKSFWSSNYEIIDAAKNVTIGMTKYRWTGKAELQLNGKMYEWGYKNWWTSIWAFSHNGHDLVRILNHSWSGLASKVDVLDEHADPLLIPLGWFLYYQYIITMAAAM